MSKRKQTASNGSSSPARQGDGESFTDPHRLAEIHQRRFGLESPLRKLRFWRDQWWVWDGRRYSLLPMNDQRAQVTRTIKAQFDSDRQRLEHSRKTAPRFDGRVTRSLVSNVLQALQSITLVAASVDQPAWLNSTRLAGKKFIALRNGLLDVDALLNDESNILQPHSPDWFSTVYLDYPFEPAATYPQWLAFLDKTLDHDTDRIALLQEWFGYCLALDTSLQRFLIMVGDGANGKTVALLVLTALLGAENVSHVPLEQFDARFPLAATLGKLANVATEIGDIDKSAEGILKQYVSGDPMFFDRKHLPGLHARPTARLVFATNSLPQFKDRSSGLWRRMMVLPFDVVIPKEQQDPKLVDRLTLELPGVLNWAIEGLRRLLTNGSFTEPSVCREAHDAYRIQANPARAFLREYIVAETDGHIACGTLYQRYRQWSSEHGYSPALDSSHFGHEIRREFPNVQRVKTKSSRRPFSREWAYQGLAFGREMER